MTLEPSGYQNQTMKTFVIIEFSQKGNQESENPGFRSMTKEGVLQKSNENFLSPSLPTDNDHVKSISESELKN